MAVSVAQKMAKEKYRNDKRDQMTVEIPKGKRDAYKLIAAELGLSLSMLVQASIEDYGANHAVKIVVQQDADQKLTTEQKRLVEEFSKLPVDAQKHLMKFVAAVNDQSAAD